MPDARFRFNSSIASRLFKNGSLFLPWDYRKPTGLSTSTKVDHYSDAGSVFVFDARRLCKEIGGSGLRKAGLKELGR